VEITPEASSGDQLQESNIGDDALSCTEGAQPDPMTVVGYYNLTAHSQSETTLHSQNENPPVGNVVTGTNLDSASEVSSPTEIYLQGLKDANHSLTEKTLLDLIKKFTRNHLFKTVKFITTQ